METVQAKYVSLKSNWKDKNLPKVRELLEEIKIALTEISFLPTMEESRPDEKALLVARESLEIGAQYSVAVEDVQAFERYVAILKTYYADYAGILPESARMYELLGLNLMCLLGQNHLTEFHTELELLPANVLLENPYIAVPVRLEQFIMEGCYHKVIDTKDNVPSESYNYFVKQLLVTIRDEIASCMEKSYETMSATECRQLLVLDANGNEFKKLINDRGWHCDKKGIIRFSSADDKKQQMNMEAAAKELAEMAISYAKEMEQIV